MSAWYSLPAGLNRIGGLWRRWRAQVRLLAGLAALMAALAVFGAADLVFRLGPSGRWLTFAVLLGLAGATAGFVAGSLRRRLTAEGLAALVERTFPELDNGLINYVQFSRAAGDDPFKAAYVRRGAPDLNRLDCSRLKDRRAQVRALLLFATAVVLVALPSVFLGRAWGVAVLRAANPIARAEPVTLTRLIAVEPGNAVVPLGATALLSVRLDGHPGHRVLVEVHPDDADRTVYDLGKILQEGIQEFAYPLPRVNTGVRYRFRAGDATPSEWYALQVRPPPALDRIRIRIAPPEYTAAPVSVLDARTNEVVAPIGSRLTLSVSGNEALERVRATAPGTGAVSLVREETGRWTGSLLLMESGTLSIRAEDGFGAAVTENLACRAEPDRPPAITVVAPAGRAVLAPGQRPKIVFEVADDYGVAAVHLERMASDQAPESPGEVLQDWKPGGERAFHMTWAPEDIDPSAAAAFRLVARDANPFGPEPVRSRLIVFQTPAAQEAADSTDRFEAQALEGVAGLIEMQKTNLDHTRARQAAPVAAGEWPAAVDRQGRIRAQTVELLKNPARPFGAQTEPVGRMVWNEMPLAVAALETVAASTGVPPAAAVSEAVRLQEAILRGLTAAQAAAERVAGARRLSGLEAQIEALIAGERAVRDQVRGLKDREAAGRLAEKQDATASDLAAFVRACGKDAEAVRPNDPEFAASLEALVAQAEKNAIRNDMLLASDRIEKQQTAEAFSFAGRAYDHLLLLKQAFSKVQLREEAQAQAAMAESLEAAADAIAKNQEIHEKVIAAMDAIRGQDSANDAAFDAFLEEYKELAANTKESVLTVPRDLHAFSDLSPANDLIEDVVDIYQEIEQAAGSEAMGAKDVIELAYAKEQQLVDLMKEISEEIDDMEQWLQDKPDHLKVTTEAFDREELPESGIATAPLSTKIENLLSELLESNEELDKAADDGATTHAMADQPAGWDTLEGDMTTFSADGVAGNQRPDHKEQDGRSGIGREGMAIGETAAGSGTLQEGDQNIEARRTEEATQSGQVDVDGEGRTAATGGGKLATGKADDVGMGGGAERMDSSEQGSWEGMAALMARQADAIYAQASLKNVRVGALKEAAHHLRQSGDAVAQGRIEHMKEFRKLAATALQKARAELDAGPSGYLDITESPKLVDSLTEAGADLAPRQYRNAVSDYYKLLNESF